MSIYVIADIHGSTTCLKTIIENSKVNLTKDDFVIIAGDAGLTYGPFTIGSLKKYMKDFPCTWIIMRGNHDTRYWRDYFKNDRWEVDGNYLYQKKYPNIKYVKDEGSVENIQGYNFLFVPGCYSIDKYIRLENDLPYEEEEELTDEELKDIIDYVQKDYDDIDFVIGHTFPRKLEPYIKDLFIPTVVQDFVSKRTENALDEIMHYINSGKKFKHYFGGHFHDDRELATKYTMVFNKMLNVEDYI